MLWLIAAPLPTWLLTTPQQALPHLEMCQLLVLSLPVTGGWINRWLDTLRAIVEHPVTCRFIYVDVFVEGDAVD